MAKKQPIAQPREITPADSFVGAVPEPEAKAEPLVPMKRITIAVSDALHRRIKLSCVDRGINMADAVREAVERAPWPLSEREAA